MAARPPLLWPTVRTSPGPEKSRPSNVYRVRRGVPQAPLKVGIVSAAHVHAPSFASCFGAEHRVSVVGVWDDDSDRGAPFARDHGLPFIPNLDSLLDQSDAVVVCSENLKHGDHLEAAVSRNKHVLCEKPVAASITEHERISSLAETPGLVLATAFPCPFSPGFQALAGQVSSGELGRVLAVSATNQGTCPFRWFVDPDLSGGGAMIDHVVHVADLLRRLLNDAPNSVQAETGNRLHGQSWEDTAMVSLGYPSGAFATIDSSWS